MSEDLPEIQPGVLAGVEISDQKDIEFPAQKYENALKELVTKASKRDYPARLVEVIQSWEKLDVDTPVATPSGWKTMGTLEPGDYVFGSNGRLVNVVAVQPITREESYSILFDDGSSIVSSGDHTWNTQTTKERYSGKAPIERSTKELLHTIDRQHSIDLCPGLQTFDVELPIDPYVFGCWLGDGVAANGYIVGNEQDLRETAKHFENAGFKVSKLTKDGGRKSAVKNCHKVWVHGLAGTLRHLGLKNDKHIPKIYLRASISQRIALLQGLMDTDGWADGSGGCGWGQSPEKHSRLVSDVSELLSSLGVKHQFYPYSREREGKIYNFLQTSFRPSFPAFRLKRKLTAQKVPKENGRTRKVYIQEIKPVGERLVRCISVDASDHLYLAGKSMIPTHNCALFYRGFQFLIPRYGGGWIIPGESTDYGPTMQMDLSLLPTNIYSSYAQIIISSLTRAVPNVRWEPQDADNDAQITATEAADKFVKVVARNNDLTMIQTDAARYLWTDGRMLYYTRFEVDGQRFGWEEEDEVDDIVPETEPSPEQVDALVESMEEQENEEEEQKPASQRKPRGQEVRTAHGKLEVKLTPMMANCLAEVDVLQYETEVSISRAKAMFPKKADNIKNGSNGITEGEIAKLARLNVKLGMQSTYITSDSIADDCTIQRNWLRPSEFMDIKDKEVRDFFIQKCPDGIVVVYAGETLCYARNESMDDCWALAQAYSGDGQNRNALGTSLMPIQKRLNNWLDLMNDLFVRCIPKKWMNNKAFNVEAIRQQTNIPGDVGSFKPQAGQTAEQLVFVEPVITVPQSLPDFVKSYSGDLAELVSGAYPALAGGDTGNNDTARGIAIQRDQALGRIGPTWHSIQNAEATAMGQAVRWAARCRDKSINERVPGGDAIRLEVNDLKAHILCFPQADENLPETYTQKQQRLMGLLDGSAKNPMLQEVFFNAANLMFLKRMVALDELYIPQVASFEKQLGEIEVMLKTVPVPNPDLAAAEQKIAALRAQGVAPELLAQAEQQLASAPNQEESSIKPDPETEDLDTEAMCCWQYLNSPEGRKAKQTNPNGYRNVRLHFIETTQAAAQKKAANAPALPQKPVSLSINYRDIVSQTEADQALAKAGITPDAKPPDTMTPAAHAMLPPPPAQTPLQ